MLALFGFSLAAILGPNSDSSVDETNWDSHQAHVFFVAALVVEAVAAAVLALLAFRPRAAPMLRPALLGSTVLSLLITIMFAFALSN